MTNDSTTAAPDAENSVRLTLERLIHETGVGYAELSRLIGRNPAYIQQYLKRGVPRRLAEDDRRRLARHFAISEARLGAPPAAAVHIQPDSASDGCIELPYLGRGNGRLTVDAALLHGLQPAHAAWLAAHRIQGDAMVPTLLDGDVILVDTADATHPRDGLYALEGEPDAQVKRLAVNPSNGRITILSDNASYASFADCDPAAIRIIGRVVWLGRRF